jgi:hypothetical protein
MSGSNSGGSGTHIQGPTDGSSDAKSGLGVYDAVGIFFAVLVFCVTPVLFLCYRRRRRKQQSAVVGIDNEGLGLFDKKPASERSDADMRSSNERLGRQNSNLSIEIPDGRTPSNPLLFLLAQHEAMHNSRSNMSHIEPVEERNGSEIHAGHSSGRFTATSVQIFLRNRLSQFFSSTDRDANHLGGQVRPRKEITEDDILLAMAVTADDDAVASSLSL